MNKKTEYIIAGLFVGAVIITIVIIVVVVILAKRKKVNILNEEKKHNFLRETANKINDHKNSSSTEKYVKTNQLLPDSTNPTKPAPEPDQTPKEHVDSNTPPSPPPTKTDTPSTKLCPSGWDNSGLIDSWTNGNELLNGTVSLKTVKGDRTMYNCNPYAVQANSSFMSFIMLEPLEEMTLHITLDMAVLTYKLIDNISEFSPKMYVVKHLKAIDDPTKNIRSMSIDFTTTVLSHPVVPKPIKEDFTIIIKDLNNVPISFEKGDSVSIEFDGAFEYVLLGGQISIITQQ